MFAASLVTASATAQALRSLGAGWITLVAMGAEGCIRSSEDEVCAVYLRDVLEGSVEMPMP
jgi:2-phosphosulfolactate phosphatase